MAPDIQLHRRGGLGPSALLKPKCREHAKFGHTKKLYVAQGHVSNLTTPNAVAKRPPVTTMRVSSRLRAKKGDAERQEQLKRRQEDRDRRGGAHHCEVQGCHKSARHRGSQCNEHFNDNVIDKNQLPLIYQGCPQSLQQNHSRIRWTPFRTKIATWINANLDLSPPDPHRDRRSPEMVLVRGWKGSQGGLHEAKGLNGSSILTRSY